MRILLAVFAALAFSFTAAFAADPAGSYRVEGSNPGNSASRYSGTVTVERTGETYRVTWVFNNQRHFGTGIVNRGVFSVSWSGSNASGIVVYNEDGSNWNGTWAVSDGRQLGREVWIRR
jgi:hypothetical protein